jgi:hypothetical protein
LGDNNLINVGDYNETKWTKLKWNNKILFENWLSDNTLINVGDYNETKWNKLKWNNNILFENWLGDNFLINAGDYNETKWTKGHATAQAVSRWLPTAAARVQTRV